MLIAVFVERKQNTKVCSGVKNVEDKEMNSLKTLESETAQLIDLLVDFQFDNKLSNREMVLLLFRISMSLSKEEVS